MTNACRIAFSVLTVLTLLFVPGIAAAEKRVALVIGNSAYQNTIQLNNPIKDSKDVAAALRRLDFEVTEYQDVNFFDMRTAMAKFGRDARTADMAVFYFAGHGMEVRGENWLVPVDAKLLSDYDMEDEAIDLSYVMGKLRGTKKLGLVILDACRNNPFTASMARTTGIKRAVNRGFARVEPENNILVAYAAREGTLAGDGKTGENSPYAAALLQHMETPNLDVRFIFGRVRDSVVSTSNGGQIPHIYGSLPGRSILLKTEEKKLDNTAEIAFWNSIKNSKEQAVFEAYLATYEYGIFTNLALAKIDLIQQRQEKLRHAMEATLEAEKTAQAKYLEEQSARLAEEKRATLAATNKAELAAKRAVLRDARDAELAAERAKLRAQRTAELVAERELSSIRKAALEEAQNLRTELEKRLARFENAKPPRKTLSTDQIKIARLEQSGDQTEVKQNTIDEKELARQIQKQLNRIGCTAGTPDGLWGQKSRRALRLYGKYSKVELASLDPSTTILDQIKSKQSRICPLNCRSGYEKKNDKCVRVKRNASLETKKPDQRKTTKLKKTASSGNCPASAHAASFSIWPPGFLGSDRTGLREHPCGRTIFCSGSSNTSGDRSCRWR